jgi:hemolysin activation/secretion protein
MAIIDDARASAPAGFLRRDSCAAATILVLTGWLALSPARAAEDFSRIAPKAVPASPTPPTVMPLTRPSVTAPDENQVLIAKLSALVFVPNPQAVAPGLVHAQGIELRNLTPPDEPGFRSLTTPYLGQSLTLGKLNALVQQLIVFYRRHDRPVVDVAVPAQDITNGVLQVVVLEARVGRVTVSGNRWFSNSEITDGVYVQPGDPIRADALQRNLDFLNENPFRTTELVYRPGEKLGETDLVLQTHDRFPVRFYAGYEDTGDAETGFDRYLAGFNYGDLFGLGQQLNYQYTTSGNGDTLRAHSASYVIPLPWQHTLTFFGSYVDTKGDIPGLFGLKGRSYQLSGRYNIALPSFALWKLAFRQSVSAGFDYKYNNDSLEFGNAPAAGTLYEVDQFVLNYNAVLTDPYGQTSLNENLYISPGGLSGENNDTAFNGTHVGATADYVYNTLVLERLTKLPADWSLILRGTLQTSNANLVPSEQLGLGGYDTVRGYDEREVNTDDGYIFTTEVRTPTVSLGDMCHFPEIKDQLQFLGFWDYASASNHNPLPGEREEIPLSSVGLGVRYTINTYVSVRYDYGFQLLRTGFDNDHGSRSDIGVVVSY